MKNIIIAIDGPSGTGKGTIASRLARIINFNYLDSGLYYRAIAFIILKKKIAITNIEAIIDETEKMILEKNINNAIILNNEILTTELRSYEVDNIVGEVSDIIPLRVIINKKIRSYCKGKNIVIDGRDIGTNVFPDARIKIYLDASIETRAKRKYEQNLSKNIITNYENILNNIKKRDDIDFNRKFGALKKAKDAFIIDTTNITIEETINKIVKIIEGELK